MDKKKVINTYANCILNDKQCCSDCYTGGPGLGIACRQKVLNDVLYLLRERKTLNDFASWLKNAMAEKKLQQRDLAYLLGISEQNISRYANGVIIPSLNTINRILRVFNCHLEIVPDGREDNE